MKTKDLRPLTFIVATGMLVGLGLIFLWVPTDCSQIINGVCNEGTVQRIFYVHVPSAWVAYLAYTVVLISSLAFLKTRSDKWDLLAHSSAEVGVMFTGICLLSGMMWGKAIWGTYWRWDPRLTLTFILFLVYLGYLAFRSMANEPARAAPIAAVIGIVGFVTVPLVHFSVVWWHSKHPAPIVVNPAGSPELPPSMLITLMYMLGVFTLLYTLMLALRVRLGRLERRIELLEAA
jgi:heme exporter protein C